MNASYLPYFALAATFACGHPTLPPVPPPPHPIRFVVFAADVGDDVRLCFVVTDRMRFDHPNVQGALMCSETVGEMRARVMATLQAGL